MKFLKLKESQHVELIVRASCSVRSAIDDAIDFVLEHGLEGADLEYAGFLFGIYKDDFEGRRSEFAHNLEEEYNNCKKQQIEIINKSISKS